jgi:hypothetical protein
VDPELGAIDALTSSWPRRRPPSQISELILRVDWVPAFAGMTVMGLDTLEFYVLRPILARLAVLAHDVDRARSNMPPAACDRLPPLGPGAATLGRAAARPASGPG